MAFHKIDSDSVNSITNQLDFFTIPPTNVSVSSAKVFEILPSNPLTDTPYHFKIHSSDNYIDLSKCYLFTEFRIQKYKADGTLTNLVVDTVNAANTDNVAPIQLIGNTFINNMRISINGREIFNANSLMAYKSYFSHELSFSPVAKLSHLEAAGYAYDNGNELEKGLAYDKRKEWFAKSKTVQCISKLDADLFCQPKLLLSQTEIDISILPNESNFLLIAPSAGTTKYHFEVVNCKLYIKKDSLIDGLALDIARKLDLKPARYAVRKTLMKSAFISAGRYQFNANLFMDQIPRRIIMGLVANADFVGNLTTSPFNFQNFNVREISIVANGRIYPQAPYDFDYKNGKCIRAFQALHENCGFANSLEGNGINLDQFKKTHCIYVFNLTNSLEDQGGVFDLIKNGTTEVDIKFNDKVPEGGIALVVMAECDSLIMLDKNRTISSDTTI